MRLVKFIAALAVIVLIANTFGERSSDEQSQGEAGERIGATDLASFDNPAPSPRLAAGEIARGVDLSPWVDVCSSGGEGFGYCGDVGAKAVNCCGGLKGIEVGWIVGVAWRPAGTLISRSDQDPRVSDRDAFYYIVIDAAGSGYVFLRQAREITAI